MLKNLRCVAIIPSLTVPKVTTPQNPNKMAGFEVFNYVLHL